MIQPAFSFIEVSRAFDASADAVFKHWSDPETRVRWETPAGSGMSYSKFDSREGGQERVEITANGQSVGHMDQFIRVMRDNVLVAEVTGVFGGSVGMVMLVTLQVTPEGQGCILKGTSQVVDLGGRDVTGEHTAGWNMMIDNFAKDFAEHGAE